MIIHGYILREYTAFKKVMEGVFEDLAITDFQWKRVDMSFSTMDNKYYPNYTKLNRLLIACIANSQTTKIHMTQEISGMVRLKVLRQKISCEKSNFMIKLMKVKTEALIIVG